MSDNFKIPKTLDDPALILFFEADTAVLFVAVIGIFGLISFIGENAVHGSDSVENANNEISFFFAKSELV